MGQQLVMTPQLRQAIRLLQMSTAELEAEIAEAVETNPLLDWAEDSQAPDALSATGGDPPPERAQVEEQPERPGDSDDWQPEESPWSESSGASSGGSFDDDDLGSAAERVAESDTLQDHLLWQLHLSHLSARDRRIGAAVIDAIEDDGYLRTPFSDIAQTLLPEISAGEDEIHTVLRQLQRFDPVGVGARSLGECLRLQLDALSPDTAGRALALVIAQSPLLENCHAAAWPAWPANSSAARSRSSRPCPCCVRSTPSPACRSAN